MLTLMRHAETEYNREPKRFQGRVDTHLSNYGRRAARCLRGIVDRYDRIVASPAARCRETIESMTARQGVPVVFDERLWEIDVGWWAGRSVVEVADRDPVGYRQWINSPESAAPGGGESVLALRVRVCAAISELVEPGAGVKTLVVTHGGPIRVARVVMEGRPLADYHVLDVPNLAEVAVEPERWRRALCCGAGH